MKSPTPGNVRRIAVMTAACCALLCGGHVTRAAEPQDKAEATFLPGTFPETIEKFEKATGWKIGFAKGTQEFLRSFWNDQRFPRSVFPDSPLTIPFFTEIMDGGFGLVTTPDDATRTLLVDFPWKTTDPRPAAELLKFCMEKGSSDPGKDASWLNAFNSLLCKEKNFEKGASLRQREILSEMFHSFHSDQPERPLKMKFLLRAPIQSVSGEKFLGIFFKEPIQMYPGRGSLSYYWFKEDGTLVGVGMMNTGHRTELLNASVNHRVHDGKEEATEVHLVLRFNLGDAYMARLVLEDSGLRLIHLFDSFGDTLKNDYGVGESLLSPEK